jgi:hypothetical protein
MNIEFKKQKKRKFSSINGKNMSKIWTKRKKRKTNSNLNSNVFNVTQINEQFIDYSQQMDSIEDNINVINNQINSEVNNSDNSNDNYMSANSSLDLNHRNDVIIDETNINNNNNINNNDNNINSSNNSNNNNIIINNNEKKNKKKRSNSNKNIDNKNNNNIKRVNKLSQISYDKNKFHLSDARLHILFPKLKCLTKEDKTIAAEEGLTIKCGKYTREEDAILTRNWEQFCNDYIVDMPHLALGFFRYCKTVSIEDKIYAQNLVNQSQMILRLAKGLPERTLFSLYARARKLFSGLTKTDTLTQEERQQILDLYQEFGNQYSLIAERLLVDIKTVSEIIRNNLKPNLKKIRKGLWDENEENDLLNAIKDIFKDQDLRNSYQNIPWSLVATKMNRNEVQCRQHFYSTLCWKILHPDSQRKSHWKRNYDSIKLVYFLHRSDYENENQIDWDLLKEKFAEFVNYLII